MKLNNATLAQHTRLIIANYSMLHLQHRPGTQSCMLHTCVLCTPMHTQLAWSKEQSLHCLHAIILAHSNMPSSDPVIVKLNPGKLVTGTPDSDLVIVKPDPADSPKQAAEKLVWSFLVLFENLVSARTLLKSLQEATLLVTPAPGQPALVKGTETSTAEAFVKKLQVRDILTRLCISSDSVCLPCLHLALPGLTYLRSWLGPMSAIAHNNL